MVTYSILRDFKVNLIYNWKVEFPACYLILFCVLFEMADFPAHALLHSLQMYLFSFPGKRVLEHTF